MALDWEMETFFYHLPVAVEELESKLVKNILSVYHERFRVNSQSIPRQLSSATLSDKGGGRNQHSPLPILRQAEPPHDPDSQDGVK